MPPLSLLHLSGPRQGEVDILYHLPATIGSEPGQDVVVPGVAPQHALIFRDDEDVLVKDADSGHGTYLIGEPIREAVLRDGDVLELGSGGPKLRFRNEGAEPGFRERARRWARHAPNPLGAWAAFRTALAHTSHGLRVALAAVLITTVALLVWSYLEGRRLRSQVQRLDEAVRSAAEERQRFLARIEDERRRAALDRESLESRIEASRQREEALSRQVNEAADGQVKRLREELDTAHERLATLEEAQAAGERIIREYGAGVCLIQGSYAFYDAEERPLRYRTDEQGRNLREEDGSLSLSTDAGGAIHSVDYFGTGFLVDARGLILTNRHVAQPWWKDETAQSLAKEGYHARFVRFRAFFPRSREALQLEVVRVSERMDLGVVRARVRGLRIPVLPLDITGQGAIPGQPVVVVGYPTGLEAILAKADSGEVQQILESTGTDSERVTEALSRKGLIRPSTTQGHIGDVTSTDIVFDAPTTQGGSGGPVFNKNGKVVAVEYAVLPKFGGNSFGLPIRYALELMREIRRRERSD